MFLPSLKPANRCKRAASDRGATSSLTRDDFEGGLSGDACLNTRITLETMKLEHDPSVQAPSTFELFRAILCNALDLDVRKYVSESGISAAARDCVGLD